MDIKPAPAIAPRRRARRQNVYESKPQPPDVPAIGTRGGRLRTHALCLVIHADVAAQRLLRRTREGLRAVADAQLRVSLAEC